jgi:hypothetical protein
MYRYPLIQYKVIDRVPLLVGLNEGAELLTSLFLRIKDIEIEGRKYPVYTKNISQKNTEVGIIDDLVTYKFINHWMALNSDNHKEYLGLDVQDQKSKLNQLLRNNILSFYKGIGIWLDEKILVKGRFANRNSNFKNNKMLVFDGEFVGNVCLPEFIGLGKSVSRGFGVVKKV